MTLFSPRKWDWWQISSAISLWCILICAYFTLLFFIIFPISIIFDPSISITDFAISAILLLAVISSSLIVSAFLFGILFARAKEIVLISHLVLSGIVFHVLYNWVIYHFSGSLFILISVVVLTIGVFYSGYEHENFLFNNYERLD
jgi:hypothetical protein